MILDKNNDKDRFDAIMAAFKAKAFQDELEKVKDSLESWLKKWSKEFNRFDSRIDNYFSYESRVKSVHSFEEKLYRNNYIYDWDISDDISENQHCIKQNLTDLIGLRVNSFFNEHEKYIFNFFEQTSDQQIEKGFVFNFRENKKQKNGHIIYKFSGIYKGEYHFEVQIKSIVHNVWGEIEHKTVYKNPVYDSYYEQKKKVSETLHDVMLASDRELQVLFNMKETEEQLFRSLFFCKTYAQICESCRTDVLGKHYFNYFQAFPSIAPLKRFLVCGLTDVEYSRNKINKIGEDNKHFQFLKDLSLKVQEEFPRFNLMCLFNIDSILNEHQSYEDFLIHFIHESVVNLLEDDFDEELKNDLAEEESPNEAAGLIEDCLVRIDEILGECRIKKDKKD